LELLAIPSSKPVQRVVMRIPYKGKQQYHPLQIVCPPNINISHHKLREIHRKIF